MTRGPCPRGCRDKRTGKASYHNFPDRGGPGGCPQLPDGSARAVSVVGETPSGGTPPPAAAKPRVEPKFQTVTLSDKKASVEMFQPGPMPGQKPTFKIGIEATKSFFSLFFKGVRFITHTIDDYLRISYIPDQNFQLNNFELMSIEREPQTNYFTRFASGTLIFFGAKTKEQAEGWINDLSFLATFGGLFIVIGRHYSKGIKESPRLKENKEKSLLRKAEMERSRAARAGGPVEPIFPEAPVLSNGVPA